MKKWLPISFRHMQLKLSAAVQTSSFELLDMEHNWNNTAVSCLQWFSACYAFKETEQRIFSKQQELVLRQFLELTQWQFFFIFIFPESSSGSSRMNVWNNTSLVLSTQVMFALSLNTNHSRGFTEALSDNSAETANTTVLCHGDTHWLMVELHVCLQGATTRSCNVTFRWQQVMRMDVFIIISQADI